MVVREPTPEEVRGFLEFAGLSDNDAPLAVRALKVRLLRYPRPSTATQELTYDADIAREPRRQPAGDGVLRRSRSGLFPSRVPRGALGLLPGGLRLTRYSFERSIPGTRARSRRAVMVQQLPKDPLVRLLNHLTPSPLQPPPWSDQLRLTPYDPAFHIESIPEETDSQVLHGVNPGQDTTYYGQPAPSRPPTRTMNRSPLGRAIDLTSANIPGNWRSEPF